MTMYVSALNGVATLRHLSRSCIHVRVKVLHNIHSNRDALIARVYVL